MNGRLAARRREWRRNLLALLSGLLLFASDQPLAWWPLQLGAFLPLLFALPDARRERHPLWLLGALTGLGYVAPLVAVAGLVPPILVAGGTSVLQWALLAPAIGRLQSRGPLLGAFGAAALVTASELAIWHLLPIFGTAQCFARTLSGAPSLVAFAAFTGMAGVVFVLVASQALLVQVCIGEHRRRAGLALGVLVALVAGLDTWRWQRPLGAVVTTATIGWSDAIASEPDLAACFAEAAAAGAELLVSPETGLFVPEGRRGSMVESLGESARSHALAAAIGVWQQETRDNRIWFFDAAGVLVGEYQKTHLIPWVESYAAGDGTLATVTTKSGAVGGMICQDDNFTDLARSYGRAGLRLLALPTNDWAPIAELHLTGSAFRAIELGYAIARATSNGVSARISPRGEILERIDHNRVGRRMSIGPVALGDGEPTWFARAGDWPMAALCVLLLLLAARRGSPEVPASARARRS